MRFWLSALVAMAVLPASAHHPFTPSYDASRLRSVSGVVAELRAINPHVVVIVEGQGPDGRTGRWAFEGFPPHTFPRLGLNDYKDRLRAGTKITISGWAATDPGARAFSGRDIRFADGTSMLFGPTPDEGDRWSCSSPCSYKYPDVRLP